MKILFLVSSLGMGGAERTVQYLSSWLADSGEEVTIVSLTNYCEYEINSQVSFVSGDISYHAKNSTERLKLILQRYRFVNRVVQEEKPDLVFCILADMAKYLVGKRNRQFRLVASERSNPKTGYSRSEFNRELRILKRCDGIVYQTARVQELFAKYLDENNRKSVVIPNAVGNDDAYHFKWKSDYKKKIVAIGRLTRAKDYPTLISAFKIFAQTHPEYILEIYGAGLEENVVKQAICDAGLQTSIFLRGNAKNVLELASDGACYVLSSRWEGMPNSLMEAMAIGMPCVSTDCEYGPAELIENGVNGLLVPVGDVRALANAMSRMIDDREFAEKCGENARKILETNNIDNICARFRNYFYQVVEE